MNLDRLISEASDCFKWFIVCFSTIALLAVLVAAAWMEEILSYRESLAAMECATRLAPARIDYTQPSASAPDSAPVGYGEDSE